MGIIIDFHTRKILAVISSDIGAIRLKQKDRNARKSLVLGNAPGINIRSSDPEFKEDAVLEHRRVLSEIDILIEII